MQKLIVANWKSNKSLSQAQEWLQQVQTQLADTPLRTITPIIAPPFPFLPSLQETVSAMGWKLGVQDLSSLPAGSYTGAVSAANLRGLEIAYALIGHSERRRYFHETVQEVARKAEQALEAGIIPILCVDERLLEAQANAFSSDLLRRCVIAYEPAEAIGTGDNASLQDVKDFRQRVTQFCGPVPFLYGGSVDEMNIAEYLLVTDGAIIGTASLEAKQFALLLQTALGKTAAAV